MAVTPPRRQPRRQPKLAPRAPRAPTVQGRLSTSIATGAQPGYAPVAANTAANPIGGGGAKQEYNYLSDPNFLLSQAEITHRYGIESDKLSAASSQDRIAMERAYSVMGADKAGNFKGTVFDPSGIKNQGTYYADTQGAKESANKAGLYYSGKLGENLGDIQTKYTGSVGDIKQSFANAEGGRDIARRDLTATYGPGGIEERKAIQAGKDAFNAAAGTQALLAALTGGGSSPAAAAPAAAKPSLPWATLAAGMNVGSTGRASDGTVYRKASNGRMQVQNSNGTWRYVT